MKRVGDLSIRLKLALVILLTCAAALLLAAGSFVAYDVAHFRRELVDNTASLASVTGHNTTAALEFNDPKSAADTLAGLRDEPHIAAAYVYDRDGRLFASFDRMEKFGAATPPPPAGQGHAFADGRLVLFRRIVNQGETIGTIGIVSDLTGLSDRVGRYAVIVALVLTASLLLVLLLSAYFERLLTRPLLRLATLARVVAVEKNYSSRATKAGDDEIGQLVDGFNEMLAQIQVRDAELQQAQGLLEKRVEERTAALQQAQEEAARVHRQLLDISRQAGMAEVATGVLHNVGNVLNSVNISAQLLREKLGRSQITYLGRTAELIRSQGEQFPSYVADDPKGRLLPGFIVNVAAALADEHAELAREVEQLSSNIEHIKGIVSAQQDFAKMGGVIESVAPDDLFTEAVSLAQGLVVEHRVEIERDFVKAPPFNIDRHRALQILVNFVTNAVHAVQANTVGNRRITLRISARERGVIFSVGDNGVGIAAENLDQIFTHGFTTRLDGHGFGLHSGALAARLLGGRIRVQSDGVGLGATFTLELPTTAGTDLFDSAEN